MRRHPRYTYNSGSPNKILFPGVLSDQAIFLILQVLVARLHIAVGFLLSAWLLDALCLGAVFQKPGPAQCDTDSPNGGCDEDDQHSQHQDLVKGRHICDVSLQGNEKVKFKYSATHARVECFWRKTIEH